MNGTSVKRSMVLFCAAILIASALGLILSLPGAEGYTRASPEIVEVRPDAPSVLMVEGDVLNSYFNVTLNDADGDDLNVTWYAKGLPKLNDTVAGGSGISEFIYIPPYDAVDSGTAAVEIKVEVTDGTTNISHTWNANIYDASPLIDFNENPNAPELDVEISYMYDTEPEVEVSIASIIGAGGNATVGQPLGLFYNISVVGTAQGPPFYTNIKSINISVDYTAEDIWDEFIEDTFKILAWNNVKGSWNLTDYMSNYGFDYVEGVDTGIKRVWVDISVALASTRTRAQGDPQPFWFYVGVFGDRMLRTDFTDPLPGADDWERNETIRAHLNMPLVDKPTLKEKLNSTDDWDPEELNSTVENMTIIEGDEMLSLFGFDDKMTVRDGQGNEVEGEVNYQINSNYLAFKPAVPLAPQQTYYGVVKGSLADVYGDTLDGNKNKLEEGSPTDDYVWNFTTESKMPPGPVVKEHSPGNDSTEVPLNSSVTITFDKDMDEDTFQGNITLLDENSMPVDVEMSYDQGTRTLTLAPEKKLRPGSDYQVVVAFRVKDNAGNNLDGTFDGEQGFSSYDDYYWSFTTLMVYYGNIVGTVTDEESEPLSGILVTIPELGRTTGTDDNGTFKLLTLPVGTYTVSFSDSVKQFVGKNKTDVEVKTDENTTLDVTLERVHFNKYPEVKSINTTDDERSFEVNTSIELSVNAVDPEGDALTIYWDFDDDVDSDGDNDTTNDKDANGTSVTHIYAEPGTYKITVTVFETDNPDHDDFKTITLTITDVYIPPEDGDGDVDGKEDMGLWGLGTMAGIDLAYILILIIVILVVLVGVAGAKLRAAGEEDYEDEEEYEDEVIDCPSCGKEISAYADKCPYCKADLELEEE